MNRAHEFRRIKLFDVVNIAVLVLFSILVVFPFYNCIVLSFNNGMDAMAGGIYFWPRQFTMENYVKVLEQPIFTRAAINSITRTVITTALAIVFTAMYSFVICHKTLAFRKIYLTLGLITMYFSGGLIPTYLLIRDLDLIDNFLVYVLPGLFSMFNAVLFTSFFDGISPSLEESAKIDGANEFRILFQIILPVAKPVMAAVGLFIAVGQWNSWFDTMLYTTNANLETLSYMFKKMIETMQYLENQIAQVGGENVQNMMKSQEVTTITLQMAAMVITSFPIIALYPALQKYFIQGMMIGSVKG